MPPATALPVGPITRRRNEKSRFSAGEETGCAAPMIGSVWPIAPNPSREGRSLGSEQGRSPGSRRLRSPSQPRRVAALGQWLVERATREAERLLPGLSQWRGRAGLTPDFR